MATEELSGTSARVDHPGTAPLPVLAVAALARLDRAFLPLHIVRAVTRYEVATARYDELGARPASQLSPAEFDAFLAARGTLSDAFCVLAEARRLDLIEPAETAARYRWASQRCRRMVEAADFDGCLEAQDEMRACRCLLERAGMLHLVVSA